MITLEQAKSLTIGTILLSRYEHNADGTPARWRVNGKVKTWKRNPRRVRVPIKRGLWQYGYLEEGNADCFDIAKQRILYGRPRNKYPTSLHAEWMLRGVS